MQSRAAGSQYFELGGLRFRGHSKLRSGSEFVCETYFVSQKAPQIIKNNCLLRAVQSRTAKLCRIMAFRPSLRGLVLLSYLLLRSMECCSKEGPAQIQPAEDIYPLQGLEKGPPRPSGLGYIGIRMGVFWDNGK